MVIRSVLTGVLVWWLPLGEAQAGPSLAKQQLEYAKEEYGKGVAAMEAETYLEAVRHFEEAYRYAPDKHAFNFNVAEAALAAGDCLKARNAYRTFIQLVPDHPEIKTAERRLSRTKNCKGGMDGEAPDFGGHEDDVTPEVAALFRALQRARHARDLYGQVHEHHDEPGPFPKAARKHARQVKRVLKVILRRGETPPKPDWTVDQIPVGGTIKEVCAQAVEEEAGLRAAYEAVRDKLTDKKEARAFKAVDRDASKHEQIFKACR